MARAPGEAAPGPGLSPPQTPQGNGHPGAAGRRSTDGQSPGQTDCRGPAVRSPRGDLTGHAHPHQPPGETRARRPLSLQKGRPATGRASTAPGSTCASRFLVYHAPRHPRAAPSPPRGRLRVPQQPDCPHWTHHETEAQRGELTCPRSHSQKAARLDSNAQTAGPGPAPRPHRAPAAPAAPATPARPRPRVPPPRAGPRSRAALTFDSHLLARRSPAGPAL